MKKIIIQALAMVTIFAVSNCSESFLDSKPNDGTVSDAFAFQDKESFDSFTFGAYAEFMGTNDGSGAMNWVIIPNEILQDVVLVDEKPLDLASKFNASNGYIVDQWKTFYKVISKTNLLLEKAKGAEAFLTGEELVKIEAEAKFLRGFCYFMLARAYGNVPINLANYDPTKPVDQIDGSCVAEQQVWDQVISDLTDASLSLNTRTEWGAENLGRATKGAALAYLANAYMYQKNWEQAEKACQDLIAIGEYRLLENVREIFSEENENTDESIFEVQYRTQETNIQWGGQPNYGNELSVWTAPRQIGDKWAINGGWGEAVLTRKMADSFDPADERRKELVKAPGETYQGEGMSEALTIPLTISQKNSAFSTKYWYGPWPGTPEGDNYYGGVNVIMMRYAEFKLNYAEILFELGNTDLAYEQLNDVRVRAKLAGRPTSADRETFFIDLMNERRWELNFEPNLWFHYTRTGRASKFFLDEYSLTFDPKWNKYPVPQSERDQNPDLCQNEGY